VPGGTDDGPGGGGKKIPGADAPCPPTSRPYEKMYYRTDSYKEFTHA